RESGLSKWATRPHGSEQPREAWLHHSKYTRRERQCWSSSSSPLIGTRKQNSQNPSPTGRSTRSSKTRSLLEDWTFLSKSERTSSQSSLPEPICPEPSCSRHQSLNLACWYTDPWRSCLASSKSTTFPLLQSSPTRNLQGPTPQQLHWLSDESLAPTF